MAQKRAKHGTVREAILELLSAGPATLDELLERSVEQERPLNRGGASSALRDLTWGDQVEKERIRVGHRPRVRYRLVVRAAAN